LSLGASQSPPLEPATYANIRNNLPAVVEKCLKNLEPCTVGPQQGGAPKYVVVKDTGHGHKNQFLLIAVPTVSGIEANVTSNHLPNYWHVAWTLAPSLLDPNGQHRSEQIGLVINSANIRDDDQLHVHLACLRADVVKELTTQGQQAGTITDHWKNTAVALPPRSPGPDYWKYDALYVPDLSGHNPFSELFANAAIIGPPLRMADQTVMVTAALGRPSGFYILARAIDSGEELLTDCPL
jgi:CDP-diacylglycerol pyrophosphatase